MAFIAAANCLEVSMGFSQADGTLAENTFYVERSEAWTDAAITAILDVFINWWTVQPSHDLSCCERQSELYSLVNVKGRDLTTDAGLVVVDVDGLPAAGRAVDEAMPMGTSWSITARTGRSGRSYRGRTFLIGSTVGSMTSEALNSVSPGFAALTVTAFNALITLIPAADATCQLVVLSRYGGAPPVDGHSVPRATGLMTPITTFGYANLLMDFQRRRAPAHNRHH